MSHLTNQYMKSRIPLLNYFDHSGMMVLVFNDKRQLQFYNAVSEDYFTSQVKGVLGLELGKLFGCLYAKSQECGKTSHCQNCTFSLCIEKGLTGLDEEIFCHIITEDEEQANLHWKAWVSHVSLEDKGHVVMVLQDQASDHNEIMTKEVFHHLFQNIRSGVAVYERVTNPEIDFVFKFFNKASEGIDKIKADDIIHKRVSKVFPGVKEFGLFGVLNDVWKTGKSQNFPLTFYEDDRITGWRENFVFKLPSGEVVAIYDDITERKKYEAEIIEAQEWSELILNTVNAGVFIVDRDTFEIAHVNDAGCKLLGMDKASVLGSKCYDFLCMQKDKKCPMLENSRENYQSESILYNHDGEDIPVMKTVSVGKHKSKKFFIETLVDISIQKEMERKLDDITKLDELTGIGNRRGLFFALHKAFDYCLHHQKPLSIAMIDIDFFKNYNDLYGHQQGDECLRLIAGLIEDTLQRPFDEVYRYGGEEFMVILSGTDRRGAMLVSERVRQRIVNEKIINGNDYLTVSIGVYTNECRSYHDVEQMIKFADDQLYQAKESGRNCVR